MTLEMMNQVICQLTSRIMVTVAPMDKIAPIQPFHLLHLEGQSHFDGL